MTARPSAVRRVAPATAAESAPNDRSTRSEVAFAENRAAVAEGRRAPTPPSRLRHELVRGRLVELLGQRFDVDVTVVRGGAGFGKTTALAQAMRANLAEPRGIDAWLACEPTDDDERRFGAALADAVHHAGGRGEHARPPVGGHALDRVLSSLRSCSPLDVCIVIDDVHEVASGSSGDRLLRDLVRNLPNNAHLVLSSRAEVDVPLARRRAAGQVVDIDAGGLAFSDDEVTQLARLHGTEAARAEGLAGWPSLVQLAMSARPGAAAEFLREEVIGGLAPADRVGFLALSTLGWGSSADLADVAGTDVDVERVLDTIPLTYTDGSDRYGVHPLWDDAVERVFSRGELHDFRRRALATMHRRGDTIRLGSAAARWGDDRWLTEAALSLVRDTWGGLPLAVADRWLAAASDAARSSPELRLLDVAVRQNRTPHDPGLDAAVDELIDEFGGADQVGGQARAIAVGSVIAHERADHTRLFELANRARRLPGSADVPALRFLVGSVDAALAALRGDPDRALAEIDGLPFDQVSPHATRLVTRLKAMMLMLVGRADEGVECIARLAESNDELADDLVEYMRWQSGQPDRFLAEPLGFEPHQITGDVDRLVYAAEIVTIAACLGNEEILNAALVPIAAAHVKALDPRCSAFVANATACAAICAGNEGEATFALTDHLRRHRDAAPVAELHLGRHPAIGYVCDDHLRRRWDAAELGPVHRRTIDAARALLDARRGTLTEASSLPSADVAITSLPLPWSVELGVLANASGHPDGGALIESIVERVGASARAELDRLADSRNSQRSLKAAARLARDRLPLRPASCLRVDVLGPMTLSVDGRPIDPPDLRRGRVRTLLALLIVRGELRRDQIIELLWPGVDAESGRRNLRVTLSRLRKLLCVDDDERCHRLRARGDTVALAGTPSFDVDLWEFRRLVGVARQHAPGMGGDLEAACALWRDDPLVDLETVAGTETDIGLVRQELLEAGLEFGERLHTAGRFDAALRVAVRCRDAAPYAERAHRLVIATQLHRRDPVGIADAVAVTEHMLGDLGVEPEAPTQMLLRRAAALSGPA